MGIIRFLVSPSPLAPVPEGHAGLPRRAPLHLREHRPPVRRERIKPRVGGAHGRGELLRHRRRRVRRGGAAVRDRCGCARRADVAAHATNGILAPLDELMVPEKHGTQFLQVPRRDDMPNDGVD